MLSSKENGKEIENKIENEKPKTILIARHLPTDKNGKGSIKKICLFFFVKLFNIKNKY